MKQINTDSGKQRDIRAPFKWKQPKKPIVAEGPTTVVNVPPGAPGNTIQVPWPGKPGQFISVNVPRSARPGQAMLVPIPKDSLPPVAADASGVCDGSSSGGGSGGWSTG